jgi:polyisoprenyl-phosphate glycosyltransferase
MLTLVVPVFRNEASIPELLEAVGRIAATLAGEFEAVFVDDGSPDGSRELLERSLSTVSFRSQLVVLSRNFGSLSAVRAGLAAGQGDYFAVMAADLQEPPELMLEFHRALSSGSCEVVVGTRDSREDPLGTRVASAIFWRLYRLVVQREVPVGGVDVFGCTRNFRDQILALTERNSTLVGLIFWLGYDRREVRYSRRARRHGRSAWTFGRKLRYLLDSAFAFSDLPIRILSLAGLVGMALAVSLAGAVVAARLHHDIVVPGYAATVLTVMFFGGLNAFGLGVIGEYVWRTFENTKQRPGHIVARVVRFGERES